MRHEPERAHARVRMQSWPCARTQAEGGAGAFLPEIDVGGSDIVSDASEDTVGSLGKDLCCHGARGSRQIGLVQRLCPDLLQGRWVVGLRVCWGGGG